MLSYSKIDCYLECPRKYKHRYIDKIKEPENIYLEFGTNFHNSIKERKSANPIVDKMVTSLYSNEEFKKYEKRIKEFELKVFYEFEGEEFISIFDAIGDDFLLEFKSSKSEWTEEMFRKELQSSVYLNACNVTNPEIKKLVYFIVTKDEQTKVQFREVFLSEEKTDIIKNTIKAIKTDTEFKCKKNKYCFFCPFYRGCPMK